MFITKPRQKKVAGPPPKKRKRDATIEEISFDSDKRTDYLTGFHKRKVQRSEQAKKEAAVKEREERVKIRKQLREERKQELEEHVAAVNALLAEADNPKIFEEDDTEDGWGGIADEPSEAVEPIDHEAEYIDEDKYTTVTVEEVGIGKHGITRTADEEEEEERLRLEKETKAKAAEEAAEKEAGKKVWPKKRKQKFRYESKAERRATRGKQHAKNKSAAAERKGRE